MKTNDVNRTRKSIGQDHSVGQTAEKVSVKKQTAQRKTLEEMNLLDDFLFVSMVSYPEIGERFVRSLLKTIFGREFKHLTVTAQKIFYGADTKLHGARLDVYIEPKKGTSEGKATVYDIEPDRNDSAADKKALPRRVRFYHGKIAARNLSSRVDYDTLKDVVIIMIMPYDPFGLDRMVYTVKNKCVEVPEMEYEDGASTLFLYTRGTVGIPSEAVSQLLHYMEDTTYENAVNKELREIHRMVETVKEDPEVTEMHIQMVEDIIKMEREITKQAEEITELTEEITKQVEENAKQAEENAKQAKEITKQAAEIAKLKEELAQVKGMEEPAAHA